MATLHGRSTPADGRSCKVSSFHTSITWTETPALIPRRASAPLYTAVQRLCFGVLEEIRLIVGCL